MGAAKSITHSFAANEYLYWHIERNEIEKIQKLLSQKPELLNASLTINLKTTPLHRVASTGNMKIVTLLVEKYNADLNYQTSTGETPLMGAAKRDQLEVAEYLLKKEADTEKVSNSGFRAIDYAILMGFYEMALLIYQKMKNKEVKDSLEYYNLTVQHKTRYVNFDMFLDALKKQIVSDSVGDYLKKKKIKLDDPVADPNESWGKWFARQIQFEDPPLVERSSLPEELQPQNRSLAKLRFSFTKWMSSPLSQELHFNPKEANEAATEIKMNQMKSDFYTEKIEVKSSA